MPSGLSLRRCGAAYDSLPAFAFGLLASFARPVLRNGRNCGQSGRPGVRGAGRELGQIIQIANDLRDFVDGGTNPKKVPPIAAKPGKSKTVSVSGAGRVHAQARALTAQAFRHLDLFGEKTDLLRKVVFAEIARFV